MRGRYRRWEVEKGRLKNKKKRKKRKKGRRINRERGR